MTPSLFRPLSLPDCLDRLSREGLRLFFPLAALHGALWPLAWTLVGSLTLPHSEIPPSLWHGTEMLLGTLGAALLGFLTTAIPEWTGLRRLQGRPLLGLAALWCLGRLSGLTGAPTLAWLSGLADGAWLVLLCLYVGHGWWHHPDRLRAIVLWLLCLTGTALVLRWALATSHDGLVRSALWGLGGLYLGLLGLILARITVPVTNLCLDPTETSTPFRPHPGRISLAPGLMAITLLATAAGASAEVSGFLMIAAGAAFLDRCGEAFVGPEIRKPELWGLALSSACAGLGLIAGGAAFLGAPLSPVTALHLAAIGGLGLAILMVFAIAGLFHTGRSLPFPRPVRALPGVVFLAAAARVLPDLGMVPHPAGPPYWPAATLWAFALLVWLRVYLPYFLGTVPPLSEEDRP